MDRKCSLAELAEPRFTRPLLHKPFSKTSRTRRIKFWLSLTADKKCHVILWRNFFWRNFAIILKARILKLVVDRGWCIHKSEFIDGRAIQFGHLT